MPGAPPTEVVGLEFDSLFSQELVNCPLPVYLQLQDELNAEMRFTLVEWIVDIANEYKQSSTTLHRAVDLLDRYLSLRRVPRRELQVVGIVALWLASKFEEQPRRVLSIAVVEELCCRWYSRADLRHMELAMLLALEFVVDRPTADAFVHLFAAKLGLMDAVVECQLDPEERASLRVSKPPAEARLHGLLDLALELVDRSLYYEDFIGVRPSVVALAALEVAGSQFGFGLRQPFVDPTLVAHAHSLLLAVHPGLLAPLPPPVVASPPPPSQPPAPRTSSRLTAAAALPSPPTTCEDMQIDSEHPPAPPPRRKRMSWFGGRSSFSSNVPRTSVDSVASSSSAGAQHVPGSGSLGVPGEAGDEYEPLSPPPTPGVKPRASGASGASGRR